MYKHFQKYQQIGIFLSGFTVNFSATGKRDCDHPDYFSCLKYMKSAHEGARKQSKTKGFSIPLQNCLQSLAIISNYTFWDKS